MPWTPRERNVTISDVAERAGVSRMTVSKVLRNTGSIERVIAAVEELGYVKNTLAGQLSSRKSTIIGVIIPSVSETVFAEMLSGINSIIRPLGLSTLIAESLFDPLLERDTVSSLLSMQPAGLIISGGIERSAETLALFDKRRCPLVSVWDSDVRIGDDTIGVSHYGAGEMMAEHFLQRGYRRIGYIGSELQLDICARNRLEGFRRYLSTHGCGVEHIVSETMPRQSSSGRVLTEHLLQTHPSISAIFYLNDAMATGGLQWLADKGYGSPTRVAVAGFNGTSIDQTIKTRLTTLDAPRREIGREAALSIMNLLDGKTGSTRQRLALRFVQGTTT